MIQTLKEIDPPATIIRQLQALGNWTGSCGQLSKISIPTLVITGTEDVAVPAANSHYCTKNPRSMACTDQRSWTWVNVSISRDIQ